MNIDWRERNNAVLADLYDGDRHLILGTGRRLVVTRENFTVPHPLVGVRYADSSSPVRDDNG